MKQTSKVIVALASALVSPVSWANSMENVRAFLHNQNERQTELKKTKEDHKSHTAEKKWDGVSKKIKGIEPMSQKGYKKSETAMRVESTVSGTNKKQNNSEENWIKEVLESISLISKESAVLKKIPKESPVTFKEMTPWLTVTGQQEFYTNWKSSVLPELLLTYEAYLSIELLEGKSPTWESKSNKTVLTVPVKIAVKSQSELVTYLQEATLLEITWNQDGTTDSLLKSQADKFRMLKAN